MNPANIASHLPRMARQQPDTPAVVVPHQPDPAGIAPCAQYTYQALDRESDIIAKGLQEIGITKGMRTVLMVKPGLDFFALVFALYKSGAVMVAVDPGMGINNLGKCLAEAEPTAFIGSGKAHLARSLFGWARGSIGMNVLVGSSVKLGWRMTTLNQVRRLGEQQSGELAWSTAPEDIAAILFTSGSTGIPKGVVYTHANFNAQVAAIINTFNIEPGEIDLATFPLFGLFAPAMGMTAVVPDMDFTRPGRADPVKIAQAIDDYGVTTMFGSPALLNRVGRWGVEHNKRFPSLKRVLSAGAPVAASILKTYQQLLQPGVPIYTPYGATESLPVSSIDSDTVINETSKATEQGKGVCVGYPVAGVTVKIIEITDEPILQWSDDRLMDTNLIGEIVVQGPQVTASYYNREHATRLAKIYTKDKRFYHRLGDVGYLDEQGRLWFCGRMAHRVKTNHDTLFTIPCEGVFNTHPRVFRTALVGVKDKYGMRPVLCVELEPAQKRANREKLRSELMEIGSGFDHTREIKDILFHRGFPVDIRHNAKIGREQLARWAAKRLI